jgi:hypothetical protein
MATAHRKTGDAARPTRSVHDDTSTRLREAAGPLTAEAVARMSERFAWFRELPPDQRSWIGLVAQNGVTAFLNWLSDQPEDGVRGVPGLAAVVFGHVPTEMAKAISLRQTVDLVRVTVSVVEEHAPDLAPPSGRAALREAVLIFSRDVAFAAAEVYARAAEQRGAWDARLEALVVDHVLREEPADIILSRAAALGWATPAAVAVVAGTTPPGDVADVLAVVHEAANRAHLPVLAGVQGTQLVVVIGVTSADGAVREAVNRIVDVFGEGPVIYGEPASGLAAAGATARAVLAGARVAGSWPGLPRPAPADALLPERALDGDHDARTALVQDVYNVLTRSGGDLLPTVARYVETGGSLEATARALYVHPNTVRYRLRKAGELTSLTMSAPRDRFVTQVALIVGRLHEREQGSSAEL